MRKVLTNFSFTAKVFFQLLSDATQKEKLKSKIKISDGLRCQARNSTSSEAKTKGLSQNIL
jgi:hypothetical protein